MLSALFTIFFVHWAAMMVPGPNVLMIIHMAMTQGRKAAIFSALGIVVCTLIWSGGALLGINSLFTHFPKLRLITQIIGVVYIFYIAFNIIVKKPKAPPMSDSGSSPNSENKSPPHDNSSAVNSNINTDPALSPFQAWRYGLWTNLANPYSAVFYGSVYSAALPQHPSVLLLILAVVITVINAFIWHVSLAYFLSHQKIRYHYLRRQHIFNRILGGILALLALSLLIKVISGYLH